MRSNEAALTALIQDRNLVSSEELRRAQLRQRTEQTSLAEILLAMGAVTAASLRELLAELHSVPAVDLANTPCDPLVLDVLPKKKAYELQAIPLFAVESELTVALPDPDNLAKLDELRFVTGKRVLPVVALPADIERHLRQLYGPLGAL